MKESIVRITTADTKKTYEFPGDNPELYEARITLCKVDNGGNSYLDAKRYDNITKTIYIELDTVLKAGLEPYYHTPKNTDPEPTETAEDLIIRLLEHVGYYPCPHTDF